MYTGEVEIENVSVDKVFMLAERYDVKEFVKRLLEKQLENMPVDEFCPFVCKYEHHMTDLVKFKCQEYVFNQPFAVFRSSTFQVLPCCFLKELLEHDRLVMDEDVICTALLLWATKWCEVHSLEVTGKNQREALGDILYQIRFPLLNEDYYSENISEKGLLTDKEDIQLLRYFLNHKKVPDSFITRKREAPSTPFVFVPKNDNIGKLTLAVGLHSVDSVPILSPDCKPSEEPQSVHRFEELGTGWGHRNGKKDAICFEVNYNIELTHVIIYGNCKEDGMLDVSLVIMDENREISCTETGIQCSKSNATGMYDIGVENKVGSYGVRLEANTKYHIILSLKGSSTYYGKSGRDKCKCGPVVFVFQDSKYSTNNTGVNIGQIAGMKFYTV